MLSTPDTVTTPLALHVSTGTGDAVLDAELRYDQRDPLAVSLVIGTDVSEPVVWVFARDLLASGLGAPTGEGDITVEPVDEPGLHGRELRITLATDCLATMTTSADRVLEFLVASYALVPTGSEMDVVDLDAEIAALLV